MRDHPSMWFGTMPADQPWKPSFAQQMAAKRRTVTEAIERINEAFTALSAAGAKAKVGIDSFADVMKRIENGARRG